MDGRTISGSLLDPAHCTLVRHPTCYRRAKFRVFDARAEKYVRFSIFMREINYTEGARLRDVHRPSRYRQISAFLRDGMLGKTISAPDFSSLSAFKLNAGIGRRAPSFRLYPTMRKTRWRFVLSRQLHCGRLPLLNLFQLGGPTIAGRSPTRRTKRTIVKVTNSLLIIRNGAGAALAALALTMMPLSKKSFPDGGHFLR